MARDPTEPSPPSNLKIVPILNLSLTAKRNASRKLYRAPPDTTNAERNPSSSSLGVTNHPLIPYLSITAKCNSSRALCRSQPDTITAARNTSSRSSATDR